MVSLPKPGPQSRVICGTVCTLSIANSTLLNSPIVRLLILFYLILFCNMLLYFSTCLSLLQCQLLQLHLYKTLVTMLQCQLLQLHLYKTLVTMLQCQLLQLHLYKTLVTIQLFTLHISEIIYSPNSIMSYIQLKTLPSLQQLMRILL